ncbi:MAG: hypothetical protein EBU96_12650, partial [Actinobacteria bacterium]|nr:hypothetical protein [Actinomycetota bacterium]
DTINGSSGTDTLNITGNTAIDATDLNGVTNIDQVLFANTSTNVAITAAATLAAATTAVTIDASGLTTGKLTFNGSAENGTGTETGYFIVVGGASDDTVTGSAQADTIVLGLGADSVVGGGGVDIVDLGSDASIDNVNLSGVTATANRVVISNFSASYDVLQLDVDNTTVTTADTAAPVLLTAAITTVTNGSAFNLGGLAATNATDVYELTGGYQPALTVRSC